MDSGYIAKCVRVSACVLVFSLVGVHAWSGELSPEQMLRKSLNLYEGIQDYQAHVKVQVRMEGVDIPDRTAILYYKKPDKLKIQSDQIILLPRQAVLYMHELGTQVHKQAKVILIGKISKPQKLTYVLKIIPKKDNPSKPLRILVYLDGRRWTVDTMKIYEGEKLIAQLDATYTHVKEKFWLPSALTLRLTTAIGAYRGSANKGGTASIAFSDYRVNLGLGDGFFEQS